MRTTTRRTLTGHEAIDYAEEHGLTLHKHTDPTEEARAAFDAGVDSGTWDAKHRAGGE